MEIEGGDDEARGWLGRQGEERGGKGKEVLCIVRLCFVSCVICTVCCVEWGPCMQSHDTGTLSNVVSDRKAHNG